MSDNTSDDLLNQPEPDDFDEVVLPDVKTDEVDAVAVKAIRDFFASKPQKVASPAAAPASKPNEPPKPNPLEIELKQVKRELTLLKLAPQERYPELLKDQEIDLEHAHQILDCIIVQLKPWSEEIMLTKKLSIRLQTRGQMDQRRLDLWAEKTRPQLDTTVQAEALMNNMAASLVAYGPTKFTGADEEARFDVAYKFLEKIPYPAYRMLQIAVAKFDRKINTVFSEGYLENF